MSDKRIDTLIVGAGQAGIAMSEHLSNHKIPHLVLEKNRIAENWRTGRWDSLVANGPAWHDRFPGMAFENIDPDSFVPKETVAEYFTAYADKFKAPVRCNVEVTEVTRNVGRIGFTVNTSDGTFEANNVISATGAFQTPVIPPVVPKETDIHQIHSFDYRNPEQLPDGAVLVVGAGSSGTQIAEELMKSGKRVYLSVGPHERPPRRYRGRDNVWWLGVLGKWKASSKQPDSDRFTICVSGANGGHTVDFRQLSSQGITLVGMAQKFDNGTMHFAADLLENISNGDAKYLAMLDEADAYTTANGLDLPEDPEARILGADPQCITNPIQKFNLKEAGISSIVWATGFVSDYSWLKVDAFDENGNPNHHRGVSTEPGIFFLGLPWQTCRGSSFIWGVWQDAKDLADHINAQSKYMEYHYSAGGKQPETTQK